MITTKMTSILALLCLACSTSHGAHRKHAMIENPLKRMKNYQSQRHTVGNDWKLCERLVDCKDTVTGKHIARGCYNAIRIINGKAFAKCCPEHGGPVDDLDKCRPKSDEAIAEWTGKQSEIYSTGNKLQFYGAKDVTQRKEVTVRNKVYFSLDAHKEYWYVKGSSKELRRPSKGYRGNTWLVVEIFENADEHYKEPLEWRGIEHYATILACQEDRNGKHPTIKYVDIKNLKPVLTTRTCCVEDHCYNTFETELGPDGELLDFTKCPAHRFNRKNGAIKAKSNAPNKKVHVGEKKSRRKPKTVDELIKVGGIFETLKFGPKKNAHKKRRKSPSKNRRKLSAPKKQDRRTKSASKNRRRAKTWS